MTLRDWKAWVLISVTLISVGISAGAVIRDGVDISQVREAIKRNAVDRRQVREIISDHPIIVSQGERIVALEREIDEKYAAIDKRLDQITVLLQERVRMDRP